MQTRFDMQPCQGGEDQRFREQSIQKGRGLNSIPVRFALMSLVICSFGFALQFYLINPEWSGDLDAGTILMIAGTLSLPALVTFFAARKLAGMIGMLRQSTIAILDGDIDSPVDVDCACEVGGLADSFRAMVARLNSNILRMNILAYTDSVTGLPNRAVINHILELAHKKGPQNCRAAMFFIDLDGFKRINDTYGHDAGDELLRLVSLRIIEQGFGVPRDKVDNCTTAFGELCQTCPTNLVFARFAGDEFVALLPGNHSEQELKTIADQIIGSLERTFHVFGNEIRIGASIGVASLRDGTMDPRQLLIHSDIAMYRAKESGRNCVALFDHELMERVAERAELEEALQTSIEQDQLTLHYQPKVRAGTHEITGVEALARWHHPTKGAIPPDCFIPIAEQTGMMVAMGETVLKLAALQGRRWNNNGLPVRIALNVSAVQFEAPHFVRTVLSTLEQSRFDPMSLEIEVTETVAMSDFTRTKQLLDELRAEGIRISIDDFGTGYSNLSQLARLSFDSLKIDRSLVMGIGQNRKTEAMLDATINMARALGHEVVAEGIENAAQMAFLEELGCDQFQGFYIAKPMVATDLVAWQRARGQNEIGKLQADLSKRINAA